MYLFLNLVTFDEMETFGLVESDCGRTVHIISNIFKGNEMCLGDFTRLCLVCIG